MGFWLLVPFFLVRFGYLAYCNKTALGRVAHFAPLEKGERLAYWLYQLSNAAIILSLFILPIKRWPSWLLAVGWAVYGAGLCLLLRAMRDFASPADGGFCQRGLYRLSRHPMYMAYFVFFLGCVLLTQSLWLLGILICFQVSAHWIILAEERWCAQQFGEAYALYRNQVRRYL